MIIFYNSFPHSDFLREIRSMYVFSVKSKIMFFCVKLTTMFFYLTSKLWVFHEIKHIKKILDCLLCVFGEIKNNLPLPNVEIIAIITLTNVIGIGQKYGPKLVQIKNWTISWVLISGKFHFLPIQICSKFRFSPFLNFT